MKRCFSVLFLLIIIIHNARASEDGRWKLSIHGEDQIEFGTEHLAGGLVIKWQTTLDFTIKDGAFETGTGTASLNPDIQPFSRPVDIFSCEQVVGTFASRSGLSFSTPHLRYQAFPLTGKLENHIIQLNPFLEYPGNYYAVLYECQTQREQGAFWIERAPRVSRELSKRQDSTVKHEKNLYSAHIKEVKNIAPGLQIKLPLKHGYHFSLVQDYGLRKLEYRLQHLGSDAQ